jgi:hypothetical protein
VRGAARAAPPSLQANMDSLPVVSHSRARAAPGPAHLMEGACPSSTFAQVEFERSVAPVTSIAFAAPPPQPHALPPPVSPFAARVSPALRAPITRPKYVLKSTDMRSAT